MPSFVVASRNGGNNSGSNMIGFKAQLMLVLSDLNVDSEGIGVHDRILWPLRQINSAEGLCLSILTAR